MREWAVSLEFSLLVELILKRKSALFQFKAVYKNRTMKIKVIIGVTGLVLAVLSIQLLIAKYQADTNFSLAEELRSLLPTKADYDSLCDGVSVDPKVASGPSQLLDRINDSRGESNRVSLL